MASLGNLLRSLLHHVVSVREWFVLHLLLVYVFIVSGILINVVQAITFVTIRPVSLAHYRTANVFLAWLHWSQLTFLAEWWAGSHCQLVVEEDEDYSQIGHEHAIVVMNHKYDIDWLMGWIMAERHGVLGSSKVYAKNSLKFVPLIGTTWWFTESIFLKRNYDSDKKMMETCHAALQSYPCPFWILLFCEGTRFTETKHQLSMEVARKKGLPELKHHLLPRPKGFSMALHGFKNKIKYVYDVTVAVPSGGTAPTLQNILYGRECYAEVLVRRISLQDVPVDSDEATSQWLHKLYQEKDKRFDEFVHNGTFLKSSSALDQRRLRGVPTKRRIQPLLNMLFWICLTVPPLIYYLASVIISGNPYVAGAVLLCIILLYIGRRLLLRITQIDKGSSFGLKGNNNVKIVSMTDGDNVKKTE